MRRGLRRSWRATSGAWRASSVKQLHGVVREPALLEVHERGARFAAARGSCVTITKVVPACRFKQRHQREHLFGVLAVEVAGRLVGEHEQRIVHERARDRHALLLAARELAGAVVEAVAEPDDPQRRLAALAPLVAAVVGDQERDLDVLERGEHRDQVVELEDEADARGSSSGRARAR